MLLDCTQIMLDERGTSKVFIRFQASTCYCLYSQISCCPNLHMSETLRGPFQEFFLSELAGKDWLQYRRESIHFLGISKTAPTGLCFTNHYTNRSVQCKSPLQHQEVVKQLRNAKQLLMNYDRLIVLLARTFRCRVTTPSSDEMGTTKAFDKQNLFHAT